MMTLCKCLTAGFIRFLKKSLNLLGWHCLIKLYRFQVHNSIIHNLYFSCVFSQNQVSFHHHLCPVPSSTSPTPFPSGNHHIVVCIYEFPYFFLNPITFISTPPSFLPLWQLSVCSLCSLYLKDFLFCLLCLFIRFYM